MTFLICFPIYLGHDTVKKAGDSAGDITEVTDGEVAEVSGGKVA